MSAGRPPRPEFQGPEWDRPSSSTRSAWGRTSCSHVSSKAELLLLLQDEAAGDPPDVDLPVQQWREGLQEWAQALRQVHRRHPWLARLPVTGPPSGPQQLAWLEVALHALRGTRMTPAERLAAATLVSGYVRQAALLEQDLASGHSGENASGSAATHWHYLPQLLQEARHPQLLTVLAELAAATAPADGAPSDQATDQDADFAYGLQRVLDGLATVA